MLVKAFGLVAASALAANAFMIPSTMSLTGDDSQDISSSFWGQSPAYDGGVTTLECSGCSWSEPDSNYNTQNKIKSSLAFNFTLSHDSKEVLLNGVPVFGASVQTAPSIYVPQFPSDISFEELQSESYSGLIQHRNLGYEIRSSVINTADESTVSLVDLRLRVIDLDYQPVDLDRIGLRLLSDESGTLRIMDVDIIPQDQLSYLPIEESMKNAEQEPSVCPTDSSPTALLCRVRAFMKQRIDAFRKNAKKTKPCAMGKHRGQTMRGGEDQIWKFQMDKVSEAGKPNSPHHHAHHGPHGHGMRHTLCMRKLGRFIHRVAVGFVLPILIGVVAGIIVSMLGMAIGMAFSFIFSLLARVLGFGGSSSAPREQEVFLVEAVEDEEKIELLTALEEQAAHEAEVAAPPAYVEKPTQG